MSLKGYEWLKEGKVLMYYRFKDLTITLMQDTEQAEVDKFKAWLTNEGREVLHIDTWQYKIV